MILFLNNNKKYQILAWIHIGNCMNYLSISCSLGGVGGRTPLYLPLQSTWPPAYLFSHFLNPITRASDFVGTKQAFCQLARPTSIILCSYRKNLGVRVLLMGGVCVLLMRWVMSMLLSVQCNCVIDGVVIT